MASPLPPPAASETVFETAPDSETVFETAGPRTCMGRPMTREASRHAALSGHGAYAVRLADRQVREVPGMRQSAVPQKPCGSKIRV